MIFPLNSAIKNFKNSHSLFLTFDDGPDPLGTETTLRILDKHRIKATFFVVARKAQAYPQIVREILLQGHSIGNHSLDHSYGPFFRGAHFLREWIVQSEDILTEICEHSTVGFRPPAGIITPALGVALSHLKMPLILWKKRFFDTQFAWTQKKAISCLDSVNVGDIILLHDRQKEAHQKVFFDTLDFFIQKAQDNGHTFDRV